MKNNDYVEPLEQYFRIVTNGIKFRIQRLEYRGILWWKKREWIYKCTNPLSSGRYYPKEWDSQLDAEDEIERDIEELRAKEHGWIPMK